MCDLLEVAQVQAGYLSRRGVRNVSSGTHRLLQAKDVSVDGGVRLEAAVRFNPERNASLYRLSAGDILVLARGQDHRAHLIVADLCDTLASAVFYIIRPSEGVVPGYLAWWLNQPDVQAEISSGARGTRIGYVSRRTMEHVPVMLPPLDTQRQIAEVMRLWQRKRLLQTRLDAKREQMIQAVCRQSLQQVKE